MRENQRKKSDPQISKVLFLLHTLNLQTDNMQPKSNDYNIMVIK